MRVLGSGYSDEINLEDLAVERSYLVGTVAKVVPTYNDLIEVSNNTYTTLPSYLHLFAHTCFFS